MYLISNIQLRVNTNQYRGVSNKNVIYDRKNSDGTVDRIERVWLCFACPIESRPWVGSCIEIPNDKQLITAPFPYKAECSFSSKRGFKLQKIKRKHPSEMGLNEYIHYCENRIGNKEFSGRNASYSGEIVSQQRLLIAPLTVRSSLKETVNDFSEEIQQLSKQIADLAARNQQQTVQIEQFKQELAQVAQLIIEPK